MGYLKISEKKGKIFRREVKKVRQPEGVEHVEVKDKEQRGLTGKHEVMKRWKWYFKPY